MGAQISFINARLKKSFTVTAKPIYLGEQAIKKEGPSLPFSETEKVI